MATDGHVGGEPAHRERGRRRTTSCASWPSRREGASCACAWRPSPGDSVGVRGLVMLRDLLTPQAAASAALEQERARRPRKGTTQGVMTAAALAGARGARRERGPLRRVHGVLAAERRAARTTRACSIRCSPSGTGIGIGAALLAADEWDVTTGDAWFLRRRRGGAPTAAFLLAAGRTCSRRRPLLVGRGRGAHRPGPRHVRAHARRDGRRRRHAGALGRRARPRVRRARPSTCTRARRRARRTPAWATARPSAWPARGFLATQVTRSRRRACCSSTWGRRRRARGAAAAGSPLVFRTTRPESNARAWLSATLGGAVLGGGLAWWLTRDSAPSSHALLRCRVHRRPV